jgi:redox-sensitive bicupin YhaK (pirin superfamily)
VLIWRLDEIPTPGGKTSPVVLFSGEEGRAILVGLEPGQELGEHEVRENAWLLPVAGSVEIEADDRRVQADPGMLVRLERGERRTVRSPAGSRILLLLAPWPGPGHYAPGEEPAPLVP